MVVIAEVVVKVVAAAVVAVVIVIVVVVVIDPYLPSYTHTYFYVLRGAFAGVVTIEKLKKEYKKTIPGGTQLQELWDLLSSHMQTLMESNSAHLDYISK